MALRRLVSGALRSAYRAVVSTRFRQLVLSARGFAWETRTALVHTNGRRKARRFAGANGLLINVGAGADIRPGWLNIDLVPEADLRLDTRQRLPLPDRCARLIYLEHFLEHLDFPYEVLLFFRESFRLLEPGGTFSVAVPDAEGPLREYAQGGGPLLEHAIAAGWHNEAATNLDQINQLFRQGGQHRYAWDAPTLAHYLEATGFVEAARREFDPAIDSERRRVGSLYLTARRPLGERRPGDHRPASLTGTG